MFIFVEMGRVGGSDSENGADDKRGVFRLRITCAPELPSCFSSVGGLDGILAGRRHRSGRPLAKSQGPDSPC